MGRKTGLVLIGVGVFLLVLALLSKFYAYNRLAVAPPGQDTTTHSAGSNATIFDIASQGEKQTNLISTQNVVGDPNASSQATNQNGKQVVVWETLIFTNPPGQKVNDKNPPLSATHDRVAFDAHTGEAIDCCGQYTSTAVNVDSGAEERNTKTAVTGLVFKFPFDAQKKTYQWWDDTLKASTDAVYKATESIQGMTVYRYVQRINPTKVATLTAPASFFGIDKSGDVKIDEIYSNTRTLWVDPITGVVIRGQEDQYTTGEYQGKKVATLTDAVVGYTNRTITDNVDTYKAKGQMLQIVQTWLPLFGSILGILLMIAGILLVVRSGSPRRRAA